jgi:hypothetical protein
MDGEILVSNWQKFYYIATGVIAFIAVAGFFVSIQSSSMVRQTLVGIQNNLAIQVQPTISLIDSRWVGEKEITCEAPPIGIVFDIMNTSTVPVQLSEGEFKLFFGDMELPKSMQTVGSVGEIILGSGPIKCFERLG